MIKNLKITAKLYVTVGAALLLIIFLNGFFQVKSHRKHLFDLTLNNAHLTSEVIKQNLDRYMMDRDIEDIREIIKKSGLIKA